MDFMVKRLKKIELKGKLYFAIFCLFLILFQGCGSENNDKEAMQRLLPNSQGGFSDIVVVVENQYWENGISESIKNIFQTKVPGLYQGEPEFDVTNVSPKGFTNLFKTQRHILEIKIIENAMKTGVFEPANKYAKDQKYIKIIASNVSEAENLLYYKVNDLYNHFNINRYKALHQQLYENRNPKLINELKDKHNLTLEIPIGYVKVKDTTGFVYYSKQAKGMCESGLKTECYYQTGFFVHYFPYKSQDVFSKENILAIRDSLTKIYLLGPDKKEKTYMEYEKSFPPVFIDDAINGAYCASSKGWWNMVNATMGGPFVNLMFLDKENNRVIMIDGYAFAPNFKKRNFIKELEAIARTVRFYE